jgi:hypothetical protein
VDMTYLSYPAHTHLPCPTPDPGAPTSTHNLTKAPTMNDTSLQCIPSAYLCPVYPIETHVERQVRHWIENTYAAHILATDSVSVFRTLDIAAQELLPLLQEHTGDDIVLSCRTVRAALRFYAAAARDTVPELAAVDVLA